MQFAHFAIVCCYYAYAHMESVIFTELVRNWLVLKRTHSGHLLLDSFPILSSVDHMSKGLQTSSLLACNTLQNLPVLICV